MRAIGEAEFFERWQKQHAEWCAIRDELIANGITVDKGDRNHPPGTGVTAFDVSHEQRKRMLARGEKLVTCGPEGGFFEIMPGEDAELGRDANA